MSGSGALALVMWGAAGDPGPASARVLQSGGVVNLAYSGEVPPGGSPSPV